MRLNRSIILAVLIAVFAVGWIASGQFGTAPANGAVGAGTAPAGEATVGPATVRIRDIVAEPYTTAVSVAGKTAASRAIEVKTQILGRVMEIGGTEGAPVAKGHALVRLDPEDRAAKREMAKARVAQREAEFNAADKLAAKGFQAETQRAAAFANLQQAKADLAAIEEEIRRLTIAAPFDAVLKERHVELGDVLQSGDPVASLVDLDPILVTAEIAERDRIKLEAGQSGIARLLDGTELKGSLRYVSPEAAADTRTFRIEVEIPNPGNAVDAGVTAGLVLPLRPIEAHRLSAGILTLGENGRLGVKTVGADDRVSFHAVTILDSDADHVYVVGLPAKARVITVGQELVTAGETVRVVPEAEIGHKAAGANR